MNLQTLAARKPRHRASLAVLAFNSERNRVSGNERRKYIMSYDLDVYVDSDLPIETFVKELEGIIGVSITKRESPEIFPYGSVIFGDLWSFGVETHRLFNDGDLNFEDFAYQITLVSFRSELTNPQDIVARREIACFIFENLKSSGRYLIMIVENLGIKLDEFIP